jgi:ABC-2 type transport system permease protein
MFSLGDADVIRTIIAVTLTAPLYPLVGVAFAILFRSTATPITLVLALMFVPTMFGGLFPRWWQENVISLLPGSASDSLALSHLTDSPAFLSMGPAAAVVAGWLVIASGTAYFALTRRDA